MIKMARKIAGYARRKTKEAFHPREIAWRRIKRKRPNDPVITKLINGCSVRIYPTDVIGRDIFVNGVFEPRESRFVMNFLKSGMIFFDIGANLGQYTLLAARCVGPQGRVHSFEPNSRIFNELQFNVAMNNVAGQCVLNKVALSDCCGTVQMSCYEPGSEVFGSIGTQNRGNAAIIGSEEVHVTTLDEYVGTNGITRIDLIKMDIEGAELLALRGGFRLLSSETPPAILIELCDMNTAGFGYKAANIWDHLESLGYRLWSLDRAGRPAQLAGRPQDAISINLVAMKP